MEKIRQYYQITRIKPDYHELIAPIHRASREKILFNAKEIELYYNTELGIFTDSPDMVPKKVGACEAVNIDF